MDDQKGQQNKRARPLFIFLQNPRFHFRTLPPAGEGYQVPGRHPLDLVYPVDVRAYMRDGYPVSVFPTV